MHLLKWIAAEVQVEHFSSKQKDNIYANLPTKGKSSEVWFAFQAEGLNLVLQFGN